MIRPSPNEFERLKKEEVEKRRIQRWKEVRQYSKINATKLREAYKHQKRQVIEKVAKTIQNEMCTEETEELRKLSRKFKCKTSNMGSAHKKANEKVDPTDAIFAQIKENEDKAKERHKIALKNLLEMKRMEVANERKILEDKKMVAEIEKERSAAIAGLPPPVLPPYHPNNLISPDDAHPRVKVCNKTNYSLIESFVAGNYNVERLDSDRQRFEFGAENAGEAGEMRQDQIDRETMKSNVKSEEDAIKAILRGNRALKKQMVHKDYDQLLMELEQISKTEMMKRQKQYHNNEVFTNASLAATSGHNAAMMLFKEKCRERAVEGVVMESLKDITNKTNQSKSHDDKRVFDEENKENQPHHEASKICQLYDKIKRQNKSDSAQSKLSCDDKKTPLSPTYSDESLETVSIGESSIQIQNNNKVISDVVDSALKSDIILKTSTMDKQRIKLEDDVKSIDRKLQLIAQQRCRDEFGGENRENDEYYEISSHVENPSNPFTVVKSTDDTSGDDEVSVASSIDSSYSVEKIKEFQRQALEKLAGQVNLSDIISMQKCLSSLSIDSTITEESILKYPLSSIYTGSSLNQSSKSMKLIPSDIDIWLQKELSKDANYLSQINNVNNQNSEPELSNSSNSNLNLSLSSSSSSCSLSRSSLSTLHQYVNNQDQINNTNVLFTHTSIQPESINLSTLTDVTRLNNTNLASTNQSVIRGVTSVEKRNENNDNITVSTFNSFVSVDKSISASISKLSLNASTKDSNRSIPTHQLMKSDSDVDLINLESENEECNESGELPLISFDRETSPDQQEDEINRTQIDLDATLTDLEVHSPSTHTTCLDPVKADNIQTPTTNDDTQATDYINVFQDFLSSLKTSYSISEIDFPNNLDENNANEFVNMATGNNISELDSTATGAYDQDVTENCTSNNVTEKKTKITTSTILPGKMPINEFYSPDVSSIAINSSNEESRNLESGIDAAELKQKIMMDYFSKNRDLLAKIMKQRRDTDGSTSNDDNMHTMQLTKDSDAEVEAGVSSNVPIVNNKDCGDNIDSGKVSYRSSGMGPLSGSSTARGVETIVESNGDGGTSSGIPTARTEGYWTDVSPVEDEDDSREHHSFHTMLEAFSDTNNSKTDSVLSPPFNTNYIQNSTNQSVDLIKFDSELDINQTNSQNQNGTELNDNPVCFIKPISPTTTQITPTVTPSSLLSQQILSIDSNNFQQHQTEFVEQDITSVSSSSSFNSSNMMALKSLQPYYSSESASQCSSLRENLEITDSQLQLPQHITECCLDKDKMTDADISSQSLASFLHNETLCEQFNQYYQEFEATTPSSEVNNGPMKSVESNNSNINHLSNNRANKSDLTIANSNEMKQQLMQWKKERLSRINRNPPVISKPPHITKNSNERQCDYNEARQRTAKLWSRCEEVQKQKRLKESEKRRLENQNKSREYAEKIRLKHKEKQKDMK